MKEEIRLRPALENFDQTRFLVNAGKLEAGL
jgi:hypothetical protein